MTNNSIYKKSVSGWSVDVGMVSITSGIDHVYESIEAENALSMTNNHHMYENQTPSRRPHPTNGLDSPTSDNCKRHEVFVENNAVSLGMWFSLAYPTC